MDTTPQIFEVLLNLSEPWYVDEVVTYTDKEELHIYLKYGSDRGQCPQTGEDCKIYDFRKERKWRHLDTLQYKTFLHARIPRILNSKGQVLSLPVPWADEGASYSRIFAGKVISTLKATKSQQKTARLMTTSFDIVHQIMQRAVEYGLAHRCHHPEDMAGLSLDEKSYKVGHQYITVLSSITGKYVLDVAKGRSAEATQSLIKSQLSQEERDMVGLVTMDMWDGYQSAVEKTIPQAEIAFDRFHLIKMLNKALDQVRRREVKKEAVLKKARYAVLKNPENRSEKQNELFEMIDQANLRTARAWRIVENFKGLFLSESKSQAKDYLHSWYTNAVRDNIIQIKNVAETFIKKADKVANAGYYKLTNAFSEQINSQIQEVKFIARGYKNFTNIRTAILFFFGNLKLSPFEFL